LKRKGQMGSTGKEKKKKKKKKKKSKRRPEKMGLGADLEIK